MPKSLYLDTARVGLMSRRAAGAAADALRLACREGYSADFGRLLRGGHAAAPGRLRRRYPGLADWAGVGDLKAALRRAAGVPEGRPVLVAGRSAALARLAARLLYRRCRRVLVTDLEWGPYVEILSREKDRAGADLVRTPARDAALVERAGAAELARRVVAAYRDRACDGLFLATVGHLGVRLPVEAICRGAAAAGPVEFAVIDGAQGFCHVPGDAGSTGADLYLAGCHKFGGSYYPLGFAACGRPRSAGYIAEVHADMARAWEADDPLLRFAAELEGGAAEPSGETVCVAGLFTARAALADHSGRDAGSDFRARVENAGEIAETARGTGWTAALPDPTVRSGIVLLQADRAEARTAPPGALWAAFRRHGVHLTSYAGGLVRLSAPRGRLPSRGIDLLRAALRKCT